MTRRPPRRTLRRQARVLPQHVLVADVAKRLAHVEQRLRRPSQDTDDALLLGVLGEVWRHGRDAVWSVAELRRLGLVDATQTRVLGYALERLVARGGVLGSYRLHRLERDNSGRLYRLTR